jgi:hypothetical protein
MKRCKEFSVKLSGINLMKDSLIKYLVCKVSFACLYQSGVPYRNLMFAVRSMP